MGYFIWIYNGGPNKFTTIGLGFVFGVGSILLFFVSSILMALDDIMKSCRTSILYTDEMATIYASSGPEAVPPAVTAAAKAFASAGASGGNAVTDDNRNNDGKNNKVDTEGGAGASKGSEMVSGTISPRGGGESHLQRLANAAAASGPRPASTTAAWMTTTTTTLTSTTMTMTTTTEQPTTTNTWAPSNNYYEVPSDFYLFGRSGDQPSMPFQTTEPRNYLGTTPA